jgi:hypothetical protein
MTDHATHAERIVELRGEVEIALEEAKMAAMFHETWRPAAKDTELHDRMGTSFATHSFQIIRWALRRELILSLMRIWDKNPRSLRLTSIRQSLREQDFFSALVRDRAHRIGFDQPSVISMMTATLDEKRQEALPLISKYMVGGDGYETFKKLRTLRDERLAHRQFATPATRTDPTDDEVEGFYVDTLELVSILLHLINATAFDFSEASAMYKSYAQHFWAGARGERTEGHPSFRSPAGVA